MQQLEPGVVKETKIQIVRTIREYVEQDKSELVESRNYVE